MAEAIAPLVDEIRRLIAAGGPMPVAAYMRLCLTHPKYGYYTNRDPLGAAGDFITSPEISQMFGELIGLWIAAVWRQMGAPENLRLVELGPGRGTLLHDALRATKVVRGFGDAVVLHLVEISPALREIQERRLEPMVAVTAEGNLVFDTARDPLPFFEASMPRALRQAPLGSIYEWRADNIALELGRRTREEGAALIIDYGHAHSGMGDTLQAVARHSFTDPLRAPGTADLTAHVDFEALAQCAETMGARIHGPIRQRDLFLRLGIEQRAAALKAGAPQQKAAEIEMALARLMAGGALGMGELFKAIAIAAPKLGPLPGFETAP